MSFRKPYRICNISDTEAWSLVPDISDPVCATLKEGKDCYQLRISIPGAQQYDLSVVIKQGMLYVYNAGSNGKLLGAFVLPGNILWDKVRAYHRSYGLNVILPFAVPDGSVIYVPVLQEQRAK
jgi:hypothetical protein